MGEEIIRKTRKNFQIHENENTTYLNLRDAAKAVPQEKFALTLNDDTKKISNPSQIYTLNFHLKKLKKREN